MDLTKRAQAARDTTVGFYERFGKYLPGVFFLGGVLWDVLTLTRIDRWSDNLILLGYLLVLGALIVLVLLHEAGELKSVRLARFARWYPLAIQFLLGGLFSAYVVFYFKSASVLNTWIFVVLLVTLLIANEFLKSKFRNAYLLTVLYFLALFSFFVFFVPVVVKHVNVYTFAAGGTLALIASLGLIYFLDHRNLLGGWYPMAGLTAAVISLFILLNVLYALNLMPPVPLSMTEGGVYHTAWSDWENDRFVLRHEKGPWYAFWQTSDDPFYYAEGDTVWAYTAIFAPTDIEKTVYHDWQIKRGPEKWETTDRIEFDIKGKRDNGWRGLTRKRFVEPGEWRIDVETADGFILGRIGFEVRTTSVPKAEREWITRFGR